MRRAPGHIFTILYEITADNRRKTDMTAFTFDEFDAGIVSERQRIRLSRRDIQTGDFIRNKEGKLARVTYIWDDSAQTTKFSDTGEGGSFYFGLNGFMDYSGGLEPGLPKSHLRLAEGMQKGRAWIFHHNSSGAGRGVACDVYCRIWDVLDDSQVIDSKIKARYIINPESKYSGGVQSTTYTTLDGVERVAYSNGQTLEDYLKERPAYFVMGESDFEIHMKRYYDSLVTEPRAISEERFRDMLEVLPPCKWRTVAGVNMFHVSERLTGDLVSWFARVDGEHYEFNDYASTDMFELASKVAKVHFASTSAEGVK
jgi:hypothetical protein